MRRRTRLRDRRARTLELDGELLEVRVRESDRARSARIVVGPLRPLEIVVPRGVGDAEIDRLLAGRRAWIRDSVERARALAGRPSRLGLDAPGVVWRDLRPIPVDAHRTTTGGAGPVRARLVAGRLQVGGLAPSTPSAAAAKAVERWYRREARAVLTEAADREARRLGLDHRSIAIRDQRTRWASCSSRGTLSFGWRLVVAPRAVREYVVVHELCHLLELNHSPAFWRHLDAALPDWRAHAGWLREHGHELHAYDCAHALGSRAERTAASPRDASS